MGEDLTQEFIQDKAEIEEIEEVEEIEAKELRTEEALKPFIGVINKGTTFMINRFIQITGEKYQVEIKESDKIREKDVEEIGFGEAVVKVIDYYYPSLPVDHPLLGLAAAGMMLGAVAWHKIESVKARAKKEEKKEEKA